MKILITAPSLEETENVSGISSVVRQIIENGDAEFYHFIAGRKDTDKKNVNWIFNQAALIPRFLLKLGKTKPNIVHINTALTALSIVRDSALVFAARSSGYPILLHIHGGRFLTHGFNKPIFARLTKKMLKRSSITIVLSETEKKIIETYQKNADVRVLKNAVPLDKIKTIKRKNNQKKTIIFFGRLHEGKGLTEIIEACRILKSENIQFDFKCYGTGGEKEKFISKMTEILGGKFYYGETVSGAEKWRVLAESDIFLLPSHYEGLPMALLEAMAAGCVPVVSNVGSIGEVVADGKNGFLIEPRNVLQIVGKLKSLLSDEINLNELRQNARKTVEERFNFRNYTKKLEGIYKEVSERLR